ncbi:MAG: PHP domain-containing protein [Candidatus Thermoplasmatota archaeon]|nr:PHP domain-containing protein [Candidatus Thermoplasmatota archaeon]
MEGMKLDMHVHSNYSVDGETPVAEAIKAAQKAGLSGLCLADHNNPKGNIEARKVAPKNFIVVSGCEVSAIEGHILCYGTDAQIPKSLPIAETIENIHDAGGIAVAPHPFRMRYAIGGEAVRRNKFDGVEAFNGRNLKPGSNEKAAAIARECKIGMTGGSDAHIAKHIGLGYLITDGAKNEDDIIEAIRRRRTNAGGERLKFGDAAANMAHMFVDWASRKGTKV